MQGGAEKIVGKARAGVDKAEKSRYNIGEVSRERITPSRQRWVIVLRFVHSPDTSRDSESVTCVPS